MATHIVDVGSKPVVYRKAVAEGHLHLRAATVEAVRQDRVPKGDVVTVAQIAGVQGAKRTPEWLPLCHPIPLERVDVDVTTTDTGLHVTATVSTHARTGVEMEALVSVQNALCAAWDMLKPLEKDATGQYPDTRIDGIRVLHKHKDKTEAGTGGGPT